MQADPSNKLNDKDFEDLAWSKMSALLDAEMPVEKKKRRGLIWLFLLTGLLAAAALGWWMYQGGGDDVNLIEPSIAVERGNLDADETADNQSDPIITDRIEEAQTSNDKVTTIDPQRSRMIADEQPTEVVTENNHSLLTTLVEKETTSLNKEKTTAPVSSPEEATFEDIESTVSETIIEQEIPTKVKVILIDPLTSSTALLSQNEQFTITTSIDLSKAKVNRWSVEGVGGAIFAINESTHPFLGTRLNYRFQPRWQIGLGVDYIFGQQVENDVIEQEVMTMDLPEFETTAIAEDTTTSFSVHPFLRLPIFITYQVHPRWQISTGTAYLRPFNQEANERDLVAISTTSRGSGNQEIQDQLAGQKYAGQPLSPSWHWQAGLSFHATSQLNFKLQYQQQFDQQLAHPLRQSFQLGIRYRLVKW
ncbi:MAG: hypothetical protein AAGI23_12220 [Bacteroidota bacterium]